MIYRSIFRPLYWLGFFFLTLFSDRIQAQPARPYLQQLGNDQNVVGMSVAGNGYTFILLSSGRLMVAGPDQILREPLTLMEVPATGTPVAVAEPRGIAVSPSGGLSDTTVDVYVLTQAKVHRMTYEVENHDSILRSTQTTPHVFPSTDSPVAITIAPGTDRTVWVGGHQRLTAGSIQKNFLLKLTRNLTQPDPAKSNLKVWGVPASSGSLSARGENFLTAITADASGNVFVAGRWPAVYNSNRVDIRELTNRTPTWSVKTLGGLDLPGTGPAVQSSVINYKEDIIFIWKWGEKHRSLARDAENRTAYIVKMDGDLKATNYTHTTEKVPTYASWLTGLHASNESNVADLKIAPNNFLYATGNWNGYSNYGSQQTIGPANNAHVLKLNSATLTADAARAKIEASGTGQVAFSLDVDQASQVYVAGLTIDADTSFFSHNVTTAFKKTAGRSLYFGLLDENMVWRSVNNSNNPTPLALRKAIVKWNGAIGVKHAQLAGSFSTGQLSLGPPSAAAVVPTAPVDGAVNYYALQAENGELVKQINVTIRSEFVRADQIRIKVGEYSETFLNNFDPVTKEGTVGLLSGSAGARVSISVPPNIYYDDVGQQLEPTFSAGNEKAPDSAVSRHQCTGFSVSGEAATGATNTYTFPVSTDAKVIFNWRTEHALVINSRIQDDAAPSLSTAMGNPIPEVKKHWFPANEPVTAFIDNAAAEISQYGKRYRVTGFDATGSILNRPVGGLLPQLPLGRILNTVLATISDSDRRTVTVSSSTSDIRVGWLVEGPGIPNDTTVVSLSVSAGAVTSFRLSRAATSAQVGAVLNFRDTKVNFVANATLAPGSTQVTLSEATSVRPGWIVTGAGILDGTRVQSVTSSTSVVLSQAPVSFRRIGRLTAPEPAPIERVTTTITPNSTTAKVSGSNTSVVQGMTVLEVENVIQPGTTVQSVTNDLLVVSTKLTSGSDLAYLAYSSSLLGQTLVSGADPILTGPQIVKGTPVSGTGLPSGTQVEAFDEEVTQISAELTPGSAVILLPPDAKLADGVPVRPALINNPPTVKANVLAPQTEVSSTAPATVSGTAIIQAGSSTLRTSLAFKNIVRASAKLNPVTSSFAPLASDPRFGAGVTSVGTNNITSKSATFASGSSTLTITPNVNDLLVGYGVTGSNIPANTLITAINTTNNTVTISNNTTAAQSTAGAVTFIYGEIVVDRAAASTQTVSVDFTNNLRVTLNKTVLTTAAVTEDLFFLERFKLTLSNNATQNLDNAGLSYIITRTLQFNKTVLGAGTTSREDELSYSLPLGSSISSVVLPSTAGLRTGMLINGPGIPTGTVISQVASGTSIVISQSPASSGSFVLEFFDPNPSLTFFSNFGSYAFFDQNARQQVPQWIMSGPATINYRWKTQYHVMVSTSVQTAQDFPEVRLKPDEPIAPGNAGYGNGEHWFDVGSSVYVGGRRGGGTHSRELNGWLNATVPPFPSDKGSFDFASNSVTFSAPGNDRSSPAAFFYFEVSSLSSPVRVLWNYGGTIYRVSTLIGNSVNFDTSIPALNGPASTVGTPLHTVKNFPPDRAQVVEGPSGSAPDQMSVWDNLAKILFPLRPGITLYEYGPQDNPLIVEVSSSYPTTLITHITHPDLPGINLDPNATDKVAFQRLAFSSGNGSADGGSFLSTQNGYSVLVFSERSLNNDVSPANGNLDKETLVVKVVQTRQWDQELGSAAKVSTEIGKRLTFNLGPPSNDVLDEGFVVHPNARYNPGIYDRTITVGSGPIIPVNRHFTGLPEDDLVVIWYEKPDPQTGITWTRRVQRFDPQWPVNPKRIVIASRLGSEGKDADGVDQLVFTRDKFSDVLVYNQPDRSLPGYNPNEEHALTAPSLKFLDQANPPPAAYALQNGGLNVVTQDTTHTSAPYVLVQYFDVVAKEAKMQVYLVQDQDFAEALNPDIDPRNGKRYNYTFGYQMTAGEPVQPPYPLARVIGLVASPQTFGRNTTPAKVYWEDYNGVPYAAGQGAFESYFYYRINDAFWTGEGDAALAPGTSVPFLTARTPGELQVTGNMVQNVVANAYDGTAQNPVFKRLYTANIANPTITGSNVAKYGGRGGRYADTTPLKFQIIIDTQAAVEIALDGEKSIDSNLKTTWTVTAQQFIDSVNAESQLTGKLEASLTADSKLQLHLLSGDRLTLNEVNSTPLGSAGFSTGAVTPDSVRFVANLDGENKTVTLAGGGTAQDFVNAVLLTYPEGGLSARKEAGKIRLIVQGGSALELTDGQGTPLADAGFAYSAVAGNQTPPFTPAFTAVVPAGYRPGDQFRVVLGSKVVVCTLPGAAVSTTQDFLNSINNNPALAPSASGPKLSARLTADNRIQLQASETDSFGLEDVDGKGFPLSIAGLPSGTTTFPAQPVSYFARWPSNPAVLKAGETLTYAGGEYRTDNPESPGLPGVIGWAVGEIIFDSLNPAGTAYPTGGGANPRNYSARLINPLELRTVKINADIATQPISQVLQPASGLTSPVGEVWKFNKLSASLARRLAYDPLSNELIMRGFVNDKTLGNSTLTAAPPPVYVLEPNILTPAELDELLSVPELASNPAWVGAVGELYALCRDPEGLSGNAAASAPYYVGLTRAPELDPLTGEIVRDEFGVPTLSVNTAKPAALYGPGLALVPSPAFMDPDTALSEGFVTLVENNDKELGGPVTLRIIKVMKNSRFRGAIKTITSDNVFSEQLTLRHSADFGANADEIVYQWYYREEDGSESPVPPGAMWNLFPDDSNNEPRGLGQYQIELKGNPTLLLADQLFFLRYRHVNEAPAGGPNSTNWAETKWEELGEEWAGSANSRPGAYQAQLAMGWVKRVLDRINPYEARFNDFRNNDAPSTYVSMILQAGQRFEGPVALNPDKNVVENLGLIELYETVLNRGRGLSIDLSTPVVTGGINNALLLAATRVADLYLLLGNEAYADAQDPTIGFGSNTADYGHAAASMFSFKNQLPTLLEEELSLLRGRSLSYGRPVYNRLFWNFTKSEGEVAYAMNYNLNDINKDGFIDEKDAMIFFPQGHGDAWGHYLTAIKSQYNLLKHPYFNWVSRSEFYNLLDVVVEVDYYDERKFADAAAARAKAGAEIVDLTYRSRYVEDPAGQWQGYSDTDADRAWGVDGWAKRAGQGAYLDWLTANAIIPASDSREGLRKVDRTTVTAIHNVATQLAKIQATEDDSSAGLNPLGLSPDAVPMDFEPALAGLGGSSQFEQISQRAEQAIQNAYFIFDNANEQGNRLRMQGVSANDFSKQTFEQDRDYRNRLIEIFGTPYSGQIGPGKLYPTGYSGPDLALYMYVDVNDLNDETVPAPNALFKDIWKSFPQMMTVDPKKFSLGATKPVDIGANDGAFRTVFSQYFLADVIQPKADQFGNKLSDVFTPANTEAAMSAINGTASYFNAMSLEMNLPISAAGYTFRAPSDWGRRGSPGELQAVISELVQAQAALGLAVGNYDYLLLDIQKAAQALRAQHGINTATVKVKDHVRNVTIALNSVILGLNTVKEGLEASENITSEVSDAIAEFFPKVVGLAVDPTSGARGAAKLGGFIANNIVAILKVAAGATIGAMELGRDDLGVQADLEIEKYGYELDIQQKLKEIEMMLWNEASSRVAVFEKLEAMRQVSDRYRTVLGNGMALIDERSDHNRQAAGAVQLMRYQDMAFRVFRNDSLQKYRAAFDLAQRYTYLAAKAYDYETNLAPTDPGSAQPMLQEIVKNRVLGDWYFGVTPAKGGLSEQLVRLRANYDVLKGRLGLNNPQIESSGFSLRREQAKTDAIGWKQLLQNSRTADLWEVPEFRRYCRPPRARSAGKLPGLVIPFSTETVYGRNFFGKALAGGDTAFNPTNFANKIAAAGVSFEGYPVASLAATPQVYLVPAGLDVMTIPNSLNLETRQWNVVDQALPVPFPVSSSNLANTDWIPVTDGLNGPLAAIRRFSSFRAGVTAGEPPLSSDTRLAGRSVWNTKWLLIIPAGSMLTNGDSALEQFINRVTDINLYLDTYGYSGN
jgi:hypothetical protein